MNKIQNDMQTIIKNVVDKKDYYTAYESLFIYVKTYGIDDYVKQYKWMVNEYGPQVAVICLDGEESSVCEYIQMQTYKNIEIISLSQDETIEEAMEYIKTKESKYVTFWENNYLYDINKIAEMIFIMESGRYDTIVSPRMYADKNGNIFADKDYEYDESLSGAVMKGKMLVNYCVNNNINLFGTLSCLMTTKDNISRTIWNEEKYKTKAIKRLSVLLHIINDGIVYYMESPYLAVKQRKKYDDKNEKKEYKKLLDELSIKYSTSSNNVIKKLRKEITFFYTDKGEYYNLKPIADEAEIRGYIVHFTSDKKEKAEIGVYCQHICYPENSQFSLVLLHDLAQGHNRWPNLWELEKWDRFDIGIVPGKSWAERWRKCASLYYVNPRCGTYEFGYPKSDYVNDTSVSERAAEIRKKLNLPDRFTVLYAPSWENDNKEDEFIKVVEQLDINMLVKQSDWSEAYQHIIDNIKYMRSLHEGKYENLYYIEPEENIMTALALCDMVVSDESSVMAEALMFGKPSIAVTDWMIPDQNPPRPASVPMDYVIKCKKNDLRETVLSVMNHSEEYESILQKGRDTFSNQGNVCRDIMDAIDYYTQGGTEKSFMSKKLEPEYQMFNMWN